VRPTGTQMGVGVGEGRGGRRHSCLAVGADLRRCARRWAAAQSRVRGG
jgi:hypothetical protein